MEDGMQSLEGYRLLDFGTAQAGPQLSQLLADMGMEVIKIETRVKPDGVRLGKPMVGVDITGISESQWLDMQPVFHMMNRNKMSFTINLKQSGAMDVFKRLVKISDIVLDNFSPGVMGRLGLDQTNLEKIKKDIISISLSGCGESGPMKDTLVYAPLIIALGGMESLLGYGGDSTPMNLIPGYGDSNASIHGAFAVLAALWHREETGEGQHISLAEAYAVTNLLGEVIMDYDMNGRIQGLQGNRHPVFCPHGNYPCQGKDKWVAIAVDTEEEWINLCIAIGAPELITDKRFADKTGRQQHREELDKLIADETVRYRAYEITGVLQKVNVAVTPVMNCEDQINDVYFRDKGTFVEMNHPLVGKELIHGNPMRLSEMPPVIRRYAPSIGEHNEYVLKELLGYSQPEVDELVKQQIIY
jgi:crotonobetainyl-CoA:carnitine CoA-transferase CaiB-like acyl-CoA transferase